MGSDGGWFASENRSGDPERAVSDADNGLSDGALGYGAEHSGEQSTGLDGDVVR